MTSRSLWVAVFLLTVTSAARADAGFPAVGPPDWQKTPPLLTAAAGIGATFLLIFGGLWTIRHPLAALGMVLAVPGGSLLALGTYASVRGDPAGLICLVPSLPLFGVGVWLLWQKPPFVGRSLLFLIVAIGSAFGCIAALGQMTWIDPRAEWRDNYRKQLHENRTTTTQPAKTTEPARKSSE